MDKSTRKEMIQQINEQQKYPGLGDFLKEMKIV